MPLSASSKVLVQLVADIAATTKLSASAVRTYAYSAKGLPANPNHLTKQLLEIGKIFRIEGKLGRVRAILLLGTTLLGEQFVKSAEARGLLLAQDGSVKKYAAFLTQLQSDCSTEEEFSYLGRRLETYRHYCDLLKATYPSRRIITEHALQPKRRWIKQIFALVELSFLHAYFDLEVSLALRQVISRFDSPEELAAAAATILAIANEHRQIDAFDLGFPAIGDLNEVKMQHLLEAGHLTGEIREFAKLISVFGYSIDASSDRATNVFLLKPVSPEFEYSIRLGYIRAEAGKSKIPIDIAMSKTIPEGSVRTLAELFVKKFGKELIELRDGGTTNRRLRLKVPMIPEIITILESLSFYDEVSEFHGLSQEFLVPIRLKGSPELSLTDNLTIQDFFRIFRLLRFFSLVNIAACHPYAQRDFTAFFNSLVRINTEADISELLALSGVSNQGVADFLKLVSVDTKALGHYDMQYSPLLKFREIQLPGYPAPPREYVYLPSVSVASNVIRNVQMATKLRLHSDGKVFVSVVSDLLRQHFESVVTERKIRLGQLATDIDIAVWEENTLFLFECKHSLSPTDPHEMRDLWGDIQKGVRQLQIASQILGDARARRDYVSGWFPKINRSQIENLQIVKCVLSSHRIFSGLSLDDQTAIRDYASLARLLEDGFISIGISNENDENQLIMRKFSLLKGLTVSTEDLCSYLSPDSLFHGSFRPFMTRFHSFMKFGNTIMARDTYTYIVSLDEWTEWMELQGCTRLPDQVVTIRKPKTIDEIIETIKTKDAQDEDSPEF